MLTDPRQGVKKSFKKAVAFIVYATHTLTHTQVQGGEETRL